MAMGERFGRIQLRHSVKLSLIQLLGCKGHPPRSEFNPRPRNCAEDFSRPERGSLMVEKQCGSAFADLERALQSEAKRFVESRAAVGPPANAVPSILSMLGCGNMAAAANLRDPAIANPLVARLRKGLRQERTKARAGHAAYDFNRHVALHQMLKHLAAVCPAANGLPEPQSGSGQP
jgi:hypothetical protein